MFKNKILVLKSVFILSFVFFAQYVYAAGTLHSIFISSPATKLEYVVGENLDISGLQISGNFSEGLNTYIGIVAISENDITGFDSSSPINDQILTITAGGKTTTYTVDIVAAPVIYYTLNYSAGVNGYLSGSTTQSVVQNNNGSSVEAIANSGFVFVNWSDSSILNPRIDSNIEHDINVTANFEVVQKTSSGFKRIVNINNSAKTQTPDGKILGASTYAINTNLSQNVQNDEVKQLQEKLRAAGFFTFHTSTGYFGPITLSAVKAFQAANGIPTTGFVGPLTRAALNK